jgi:SdpI/YfhL protein family
MESVNAKTAITLAGLGLILIAVSIPLLLGKIKMSYFYGFRIRKAFESEENWYTINGYGARAMIRWALIIMATAIVCPYIDPQDVVTVAKISFLSLLVPIVQTLYFARHL